MASDPPESVPSPANGVGIGLFGWLVCDRMRIAAVERRLFIEIHCDLAQANAY